MKYKFTTIRSKLLITAIVLGFAIFLIGISTRFLLHRVEIYSQISVPVENVLNNIHDIREYQTDFLYNDSKTEAYLLLGKSKFLEELEKSYIQSSTLLEGLSNSENLSQTTDKELLTHLKQTQSLLQTYHKNLERLQKKMTDRGFANYGLEGEWNKIEQALQQKIEGYSNAILQKNMRQLTENKTLYQVQLKPEFVSEIRRSVENIKTQLTDNVMGDSYFKELNYSERMLFVQDFEKFADYAERIFAFDKEIGFSDDKGLITTTKQLLDEGEVESIASLTQIRKTVRDEGDNTKYKVLLITMLMAIGVILPSLYLIRTIIEPVRRIQRFINKLSKGKFPKKIELKNDDEIKSMLDTLDTFVTGLREKMCFSNEIGKNNFEVSFTMLSDKDRLGTALMGMKEGLQKAHKETITRRIEEQKHSWAAEGLTVLSDMLRKDNDNVKHLSQNIIQYLVKYIDANQGGVFMINDVNKNDLYIEQIATFAYDRKRKEKKRFELDEGLLGRCIDEKTAIYMKQIPEGYLSITSGLGGKNPSSLLIVPLKVNEEIFGVIEIASFNELEDFQIEFVTKVGESIAATLSTVKNNMNTAMLLKQTRQQTEELSSQEEELRQNLEELQTAQEEMARKEAEMNSLLASIDASTYAIEYDTDGRIIKVNPIVEEISKIKAEFLIGKHHRNFVDTRDLDEEEYAHFWERLLNGNIQHQESRRCFGNNYVWLRETYSPIFDNNGNVERILNIAFDITEMKNRDK